jgi:ectoine hydroxylase-related dioxygenase (phytanoyl-CoA dioxygenase family)
MGAAGWNDEQIDRWAAELNQDGICVLRRVFDADVLRQWRLAFEALWEERLHKPAGLAHRGANRFYLTLPWIRPFTDPGVFAHPAILGVLDRVLAQHYVLVQMATDTPVAGSDYQELHRDHRPLFSEDLVTPLYALTVNFPLCRVTLDNGPLEVARGTHRMSRAEGWASIASGKTPVEPVTMEMGDVIIRTPLAIHRGTPNRTEHRRPMVALGYVMHWLHTPHVELTVPRDSYELLPQDTRRLLRCNVVEELSADAGESYLEFQY